jgi:hypothetical protein
VYFEIDGMPWKNENRSLNVDVKLIYTHNVCTLKSLHLGVFIHVNQLAFSNVRPIYKPFNRVTFMTMLIIEICYEELF